MADQDQQTQLAVMLVHLENLREDVGEIKIGVREQNGRVRKLEHDVTRIKATGRKDGVVWGSIGGSFLGGLIWIWHTLGGGK